MCDRPTLFALIAAFCCLAVFASPLERMRKLVGAVGIENNTDWNFKDFEEMARSAKALKRNDKESNGILIGPSMAPRFFRADQIPSWCVFRPLPQIQSRLRAQIRSEEHTSELQS